MCVCVCVQAMLLADFALVLLFDFCFRLADQSVEIATQSAIHMLQQVSSLAFGPQQLVFL